ncbi:hypothetical protein N0V95_005926 [Ascochyta clinopodiicola]|nr:hypothetical protein N0V95_005926 [Ascochyta clinopodiicola]
MAKFSPSSPGLDKGNVLEVKISHTLINIPREIRDMIYDELWEQTPRIKLPKDNAVSLDSFELCYNSQTPDDTFQAGLPQWLLCSSATLKEGLKQLLARAEWSLFWEPKSRLSHTRCHRVWFSNVTNLTLRTEQFNTFRGPTFREPLMRVMTPWPTFIAPSQIVKLLPNLKALTLNIHHRVPKAVSAATSTTYVLQIPWFDKVASCLVSFIIHCISNAEFDLRATAPGLRTAYETEVRRIGLLLIGGEGRLSSEETLIEDPEAGEGSEAKFKLELSVGVQKR